MQNVIKYQRKASHLLNNKNQGGTKFKIFVQPRYVKGFDVPETIRISLKPNEVKKGPSDTRMYVVDVKNKLPFGRGCPYRPQFFDKNGNPKDEYFDPPNPNQEGHYNEIDIYSRSFLSTTMYATIRFGLDLWESYMGSIKWTGRFERLELIPLININNALASEGYLEYGYGGKKPSSNFNINEIKPYCENFDVLCHELGHQIVYSFVGFPKGIETYDFGGFHEFSGDIVSIVTSLHFDTMVDKLLEKTKGNLFTFNILGRLAELSDTEQIRLSFNNKKMSNASLEPHDRSEPLTGAFFDILVEVYQLYLVKNNLISEDLARRSLNDENPDDDNDPIKIKIQEEFNSVYNGKEKEFKDNLLNARDYLCKLLSKLWKNISPDDFKYSYVLKSIIQIENDMAKDEKRDNYVNIINECFEWREIYLPISEFILPRKICK
jgi:hypothetical protein